MARPMRRDADYFPFICKEGKTFAILRNRFPLEGIGFFTELCIILTTTPDHHIQLKTDVDFEYLCSKMKCEKNKATLIIEVLLMTGKIHKELWEKANVIVIPDLLDSLHDAYLKRETDIITINQIVSSYIYSVSDTGNPSISSNQSLKEIKGNKIKTKEKEVKHKHGEYSHVLLTDEEYSKLKAELPDYGKWIKELDEGMELKDYKYKSHYMAILKWKKREDDKLKAGKKEKQVCQKCGAYMSNGKCPRCDDV